MRKLTSRPNVWQYRCVSGGSVELCGSVRAVRFGANCGDCATEIGDWGLGIAASCYQSTLPACSHKLHFLHSQIGLFSSKSYHISVIKWAINYDIYQRTKLAGQLAKNGN